MLTFWPMITTYGQILSLFFTCLNHASQTKASIDQHEIYFN